MIIIKSISRFARNTLDCLKHIWELKDKNISAFFEKENINTMDSKGGVAYHYGESCTTGKSVLELEHQIGIVESVSKRRGTGQS